MELDVMCALENDDSLVVDGEVGDPARREAEVENAEGGDCGLLWREEVTLAFS